MYLRNMTNKSPFEEEKKICMKLDTADCLSEHPECYLFPHPCPDLLLSDFG